VQVDQVQLDLSQLKLSGQVWLAVCEEIGCSAFNNVGFFKTFSKNDTVDSYISAVSCGKHGPATVI